jgi:hypothetical protein
MVLEFEAGLDDGQTGEQPDVDLLASHAYWRHASVDRRQVDADGGHRRSVGVGDREPEKATQHLLRITQLDVKDN